MNSTWYADKPPKLSPITPLGWLRVAARGAALVLVLTLGMVILLALRLVERPVWRQHRPWSPAITMAVCRLALTILGIDCQLHGAPMRHLGAVVANHSTWLDIFVLNARNRVYFVAKSEVAGWPGIGWLARATGTVFIRRSGRDAQVQRDIFAARLKAGHRLLFFPEGTSTDGTLVLPFNSTLFAAFFTRTRPDDLWLQPVSVQYHSPAGQDAGFYGWWGDMDMGPHLLKVLAASVQGSVTVRYHAPLSVGDFANRKDLALACERAVRSGGTD